LKVFISASEADKDFDKVTSLLAQGHVHKLNTTVTSFMLQELQPCLYTN